MQSPGRVQNYACIHLTMDFCTAAWDGDNSCAFHYTWYLNLDPEFLLKMMRFDLKVLIPRFGDKVLDVISRGLFFKSIRRLDLCKELRAVPNEPCLLDFRPPFSIRIGFHFLFPKACRFCGAGIHPIVLLCLC